MEIKTTIFICLTLAVLVKEGQAIKCYMCGSLTGSVLDSLTGGMSSGTGTSENCVDPFKKSADGIPSVECAGSCRKQKIAKDDKQIVMRSCSPLKMEEDCKEENDVSECFCNTNLCNDATTWNLSITAFIVTIVGSMFAKYF